MTIYTVASYCLATLEIDWAGDGVYSWPLFPGLVSEAVEDDALSQRPPQKPQSLEACSE